MVLGLQLVKILVRENPYNIRINEIVTVNVLPILLEESLPLGTRRINVAVTS